MTDQVFNDFKLHIEFRYPKGSNSGVYLRGRYEVQIVDSKGMEPSRDLLGAIYGFLVPTEMMAKDAGEWQSYDVTLIGQTGYTCSEWENGYLQSGNSRYNRWRS